MSSEVFSSAFVSAQRKTQLAQQLRRSVANAARGMRRLSDSMQRANQALQQQGSQLARDLASQAHYSTVETKLASAVTGQADITGFTEADISELASAIRASNAVLQSGATIERGTVEETEKMTVTLDGFAPSGEEELSGFSFYQPETLPEDVSPESKRILQLGDILSGAKSEKETEYVELLIVAYGILDEEVWSVSDVEAKKSAKRKLERIDSDRNLTVFEKIDKVKKAISEYTKGKSAMPTDVDVEEIAATYKVLCQRLSRAYTGDVPVSRMRAELEAMTEELLLLEEQDYIAQSIAEAFEEEGVVLDDVKTREDTQVYYLEDADNCEVILTDVDGGFLLETVGLYEEGTKATEADKTEMKKSAKKVCDKYKRVVERLAEKGVIVEIISEDDPEAYIKTCAEPAETFERRKQEKSGQKTKKTERRDRRRKKELRTFD